MHLSRLAIQGIVVALLIARSVEASSYAQLSSTQTQVGESTPSIVKFDKSDAAKGIAITNRGIMFKEAGPYFIMAAAQVGSVSGIGRGTVRLWMRKNGKDVPNSNSAQTVLPGFTAVLISQGMVEIEPADTIELLFSVSSDYQKLGLIASAPEGEPAVPSTIFSAFKADDRAYAQLTSTTTQTATGTGSIAKLDLVDAAKKVGSYSGTMAFETGGTYLVMAGAQVGCTGRASNEGQVRIWLRKCGKDVPNSSCAQYVAPGFTSVLICQSVLTCQAGEQVEFIQAATSSNLGVVAWKPEGEPAVPSLIVSIVKVSDGAYAQLSSLESQEGGAYPTSIRLKQTDAARNVENAAGSSSSINKGTIALGQDGVYFAIAGAQVGSTDAKISGGSSRLWLRKSGKDVEKSNSEQTIFPRYTTVLVSQGVFEGKEGNRLQLYHSARGAGVGLISTEHTGEPHVPSIIFTLVKVD